MPGRRLTDNHGITREGDSVITNFELRGFGPVKIRIATLAPTSWGMSLIYSHTQLLDFKAGQSGPNYQLYDYLVLLFINYRFIILESILLSNSNSPLPALSTITCA